MNCQFFYCHLFRDIRDMIFVHFLNIDKNGLFCKNFANEVFKRS